MVIAALGLGRDGIYQSDGVQPVAALVGAHQCVAVAFPAGEALEGLRDGPVVEQIGHAPIIAVARLVLPETQQASILADMKATFDLDSDLYRAVRVEAARADRSVREVVEEALEAWLARAEEAEDRDSAAEALKEYERDGGESAEAWFGKLAAEMKASYGTKRG